MTDHPVDRQDVTALRKEGDLRSYLRGLIKSTKSTGTPARKRKPKWGSIPIPPDHTPGAWPAGTRPPGPPPEWGLPPEAWAAAVRRYRTEERQQLDQDGTP